MRSFSCITISVTIPYGQTMCRAWSINKLHISLQKPICSCREWLYVTFMSGRSTCSSLFYIISFDVCGCFKYLFCVLYCCMPVLIAGKKLLTRDLLCQLLQQPACKKYVYSNQVAHIRYYQYTMNITFMLDHWNVYSQRNWLVKENDQVS